MKKTILLLIATLFLTACSSDDDGGSSNSIIGTWKTTEEIFINSNGIITTETRNDCQQNSRTVFNENGTFTDIGYSGQGDNCFVNWDNNGNWEIVNGNILRITLNGQVDDGFIDDYLIIENTGNTLRLDNDLDPDTIEQEIYVLEKVN